MKWAADNAISASSLYQAADGIDLLAPRAEEQKAANHIRVKSIHLTAAGKHEGF